MRRALAAGAWSLLVISVLVALLRGRAEITTGTCATVCVCIVFWVSGWWRIRRLAALTLVLDVLIVFLFLWSLGEREHVRIRVVNGQYTGQVGTGSVRIAGTTSGGRFGLYAGSLLDYRVSVLGEARISEPTTPLSRLGAWMRHLYSPAWTNIRVLAHGSRQPLPLRPTILNGTWGMNQRGEYGGSPFANVLLGSSPTPDYVIEADLMRGDGVQGLVVGVDGSLRGYVFEARSDLPDMQWVRWDHGLQGDVLGASGTTLPLEAMGQRDVRLLLTNSLWAFALFLLALPLYLVMVWIFRLVGGNGEDELRLLERWFRRRTLTWGLPACLAVLATVLSALITSSLLEQIPHVQDSVADLFQAKTLALGRLWVPAPQLPSFFTEEFIPMHDGKWFGKYPPGWPLLLAIGVVAHIPWLVDPILSGIVVLLIYAIGREVYRTEIGLLAAALTLTSPFFLFLGASFMPHMSTDCYLLAAVYLFVRWDKRARAGTLNRGREVALLVPAGFMVGMGFLTRQVDTLAFSLPFSALLVPSVFRRRVRSFMWLLLGAIPPLAFLLAYNWILTGSPLTSPYTLWWPFDRFGFGPTIGMGGFRLEQGLANTAFNLQMLLAHVFGWPYYFSLTLASVPFILGRANRWDWLLLASSGAVVLAYTAYWNPGVMYGPRYYFVAFPWIVLLTARGLEEIYRLPLRIPWAHDRSAALAVPAFIVAVLLAYNFTVYLPAQIPIYRGYNYTNADSVNIVRRAKIHHALVFVSSGPGSGWWTYGSVFSSNSPLLDGDIVYARDQGAGDRDLIRVYPGRDYYRLTNGALMRLRM